MYALFIVLITASSHANLLFKAKSLDLGVEEVRIGSHLVEERRNHRVQRLWFEPGKLMDVGQYRAVIEEIRTRALNDWRKALGDDATRDDYAAVVNDRPGQYRVLQISIASNRRNLPPIDDIILRLPGLQVMNNERRDDGLRGFTRSSLIFDGYENLVLAHSRLSFYASQFPEDTFRVHPVPVSWESALKLKWAFANGCEGNFVKSDESSDAI